MATASQRWRQVEALYYAARNCEPTDRAALLARVDPDLRRYVESLLVQDSVDLARHSAEWKHSWRDRMADQNATETRSQPAVANPIAAPRISTLSALSLNPLEDARFAPGHIFAERYRVVSLLGRGAMGEVYRAEDLRVGQSVALKLISEGIARRSGGQQRLTDEVRLARRIAHPNVCRVYDIGYADGWHYLSMEYVDGETLGSLLRRIGELPMAKALQMARQLCAGVGAAHERNVLHRDLKPSNIMVDGRGQIRIMDFGIAVTITDEVREFAGTPAYMSPEQLAGGPVTTRSDLYSLGRVLNEILPPGTPPQILSSVQACLASDPASRPASAYEIAAGLPGGDSLLFSDGRIPSPAMIAAARTADALAPSAAWLLLAGIVGGAVAIAGVHGFSVVPSQLPKPPEVLAERARDILADMGGTAAPAVDRAFWWWTADGVDRIRFTYRESSTLLIPGNLFRDVTAADPAHDSTRMRMVTLEADGTPSRASPSARTQWSKSTSGFEAGELLYWVVLLIAFVASCILSRRNLRAGEGDRNGAWRLSIVVGAGSVVAAALRAHHVPSLPDELSWLFGVSGWAVLWGAFSWLAYISFEPYGRRWWPQAMVSWTRVLAGHVGDPRVGRDVLIGSCVGLILAAVDLLHIEIAGHTAPPIFMQSSLVALRSPAAFVGLVVGASLNALVTSLCGIAVLVLFRLIVRRTWIALLMLVALVVPISATGMSVLDFVFATALTTLALLVLLRFGLVALIAMSVVTRFVTWLPLTLDTNAWYFGRSLVALLLVGSLAIYAFLVALRGRSAFGLMEVK